jgi:hypothetical protein
MRVFGVWYGGANYQHSDPLVAMESWESFADAKLSLVERYRDGHWRRDRRARVVNFDEWGTAHLGEIDDSLRPCVDATSEIRLYFIIEEYSGGRGYRIDMKAPFARLFFGPRGGVRFERLYS